MTVVRPLVTVAALSVPLLALASQTSDGKPKLWASIAEPTGTTEGARTPLWNKLKPALKLVAQGKADSFNALLIDGAKLNLTVGQVNAPFTTDVMLAASQSCLGPYLHDEGQDWVQFSWVCRVEQPTTLAKFVTFQDSPELAVTVWFKGEQISKVQAMEPGPIPGARRIAMGAAEQMQAK